VRRGLNLGSRLLFTVALIATQENGMTIYITRKMLHDAVRDAQCDYQNGHRRLLDDMFRYCARARQRRKASAELRRMSDDDLRTVGILRDEIEIVVKHMTDEDLGISSTIGSNRSSSAKPADLRSVVSKSKTSVMSVFPRGSISAQNDRLTPSL
jgi:uncharacterized protein YjiS (DUF1127 family)|tara:strand:+ start:472 stop:933 length:462 start_codon:yes stop_codon:yes gene_type:complete